MPEVTKVDCFAAPRPKLAMSRASVGSTQETQISFSPFIYRLFYFIYLSIYLSIHCKMLILVHTCNVSILNIMYILYKEESSFILNDASHTMRSVDVGL